MFHLNPAALTLHTQMKYFFNILLLFAAVLFFSATVHAQCAVCTKTSLQLGEKPAQGLNSAILYLMMAPFAIVGFIGYRWWKGNKKFEEEQ
jgi:hypothetical protein